MTELSGVVLAGGASRRMGQDKATLSFRGKALWQHQLGILRDAGVTELFLSARGEAAYATASEVVIVLDFAPDHGPLAGIAAALAHATHEYLLVLAIDLPLIPPTFLRQLALTAVREKSGVIPQGAAHFEPLAAVYPRAARAVVEHQLQDNDRSLQRLARTLIADELAIIRPLTSREERFFANINTPADLARLEH
jgi:molybdopterin-guanine dinucleotide biosynthesis protein A